MTVPATRTRRNFFRTLCAAGAAGALPWAGHAQEGRPAGAAPSETGAEFLTPETQAGIDRGLAFLARSQNGDGSFQDRFTGSNVGVSALAGLALMAGGHQPGRGRYGRHVGRAVDFLLAVGAANQGYLSHGDGPAARLQGGQSGMYNHGFGTLFLAEVCGMLPDPAAQAKARDLLDRAVAFTVAAQNRDGGWRYEPNPAVADVSVTVAQMMALRAAKNAGVFVRKAVVDQAVRYVRGCQLPDGGFSYFKGQGYSAFARSAAALVGLYSAGVYQGEEVARGLRYLEHYRPGQPFSLREIPAQHYFYGQYYAGLAMWTAGREHWSRWLPAVRDELLAKLRGSSTGTWTDPFHGPAYATAMSLIVLQLPNNYLPILQK